MYSTICLYQIIFQPCVEIILSCSRQPINFPYLPYKAHTAITQNNYLDFNLGLVKYLFKTLDKYKAYCYELNVCVLPKFICWSPDVIIFGGGAFWKWIGCKSTTLINGIGVLLKETPEISLPPFIPWRHGKENCLWTRKQVLFIRPPTLLVSWSWTSQPPELWETNFSLFVSHSVYDILVTSVRMD